MDNELERKLLSLVLDSANMASAQDLGVRADHFEDPMCRSIWTFCEEYWRSSAKLQSPTRWVVRQEFGVDLPDDVEEEVAYLTERMCTRYAANRLQTVLRSVASRTRSDPITALQDLRDFSIDASEKIAPRVTRVNLADNIDERRRDYGKREETGGVIGIPYGIDLLDSYTGGLALGELAVIGAVAKTGKTMFGLHVVVNAVRNGTLCAVFSLEMGLREIGMRVDALHSGVSYDRLIHGRLTAQEVQHLYASQEEFAALGGLEVEAPPEEERTVSAILSRAKQLGAKYIFIDQLSHMNPGCRVNSLKEHHATIVKALSTGISVPGAEVACLLAAQMRRGDDALTQESFANAAEIEREADIILGLYRSQNLRENDGMHLEILGSRRSDIATFLLEWRLRDKTSFRSLEEVR